MKAYQLSKFVIWLCRMYLYYTTIFVTCSKLFTCNLLHLKVCCHPSPIYVVLPNQSNFESHYTHIASNNCHNHKTFHCFQSVLNLHILSHTQNASWCW